MSQVRAPVCDLLGIVVTQHLQVDWTFGSRRNRNRFGWFPNKPSKHIKLPTNHLRLVLSVCPKRDIGRREDDPSRLTAPPSLHVFVFAVTPFLCVLRETKGKPQFFVGGGLEKLTPILCLLQSLSEVSCRFPQGVRTKSGCRGALGV